MQLADFFLKNQNFFSRSQVMACSGLLAMLFKLAIAGVIAVPLVLLLNSQQPIAAFFVFAALVFPIVGLIIDLILNTLKDKIWTMLPTKIPDDWEITPEQLLQYAKHLPKVRLMRFLSCWMLLPFIAGGKEWYLLLYPALVEGFFIAALFDGIWLKIFKLAKPNFPVKIIDVPTKDNSNFFDDLDRNRKISDATWPGSPAWFAQQRFNSR